VAIQKTEAFVLKTLPFRTSSLVVTTFSRSFGKVKGIAKGVRREGVIRPSTFEPFTLLEILFYEKIHSELHLISEATILETFEDLRADLEVLATAYYLVDLVDQLSEPHDPHEPIFELLQFAFRSLPSFPPSFLARFFEIQLLREIGLLPHLSGCLACGERNPEKVYFSVRQGAIFCPRCYRKAQGAKRLGLDVLEAMRHFAQIKGEGSAELPVPPGAPIGKPSVLEQMGEIVEWFLMDRIGKRLATRRFLKQVQSLTHRNARVTSK
jgi:DNA repair protein RecO (recombination protein O)